jgi:hypothetical protein
VEVTSVPRKFSHRGSYGILAYFNNPFFNMHGQNKSNSDTDMIARSIPITHWSPDLPFCQYVGDEIGGV